MNFFSFLSDPKWIYTLLSLTTSYHVKVRKARDAMKSVFVALNQIPVDIPRNVSRAHVS